MNNIINEDLKNNKDRYSKIINMNGIDVPYYKKNDDDNTIYPDLGQLFKADIEGSVIQNLNIKDCSVEDAEFTKNLYRMILTCGEFETPYVDEFVLEEFLKDEQKVINLVRKFPEINKVYFNNDLTYLTFPLDDEFALRKYIEILRKFFKNNRKHN